MKLKTKNSKENSLKKAVFLEKISVKLARLRKTQREKTKITSVINETEMIMWPR